MRTHKKYNIHFIDGKYKTTLLLLLFCYFSPIFRCRFSISYNNTIFLYFPPNANDCHRREFICVAVFILYFILETTSPCQINTMRSSFYGNCHCTNCNKTSPQKQYLCAVYLYDGSILAN